MKTLSGNPFPSPSFPQQTHSPRKQSASQSLNEFDYENAAVKSGKIDAPSMGRWRKTLTETLAKLSTNLGEGRKRKLGESVQGMLEGIEVENFSRSKSSMCTVAGV